MKLARAAAAVAGLVDIGFAVWFLAGGHRMPGVDQTVYTMWIGVCLIASVALLALVVSDPERYFPVLYVNAGGRAFAALAGLPAALTTLAKLSGQLLAVVLVEGALAAGLIFAIVYAIRERRAKEGEGAAKPVVRPAGKPSSEPDKKPGAKPDKA